MVLYRFTRYLEKSIPLLTALLLFGVLLFNLSLAVRASYSRDENLYISGAYLFSQGLVPYRDFYYTHLPYLLPLQALSFRFTHYLILAGRMISALCAAAVAGLVFWATQRASPEQPPWVRFVLGVGWVMILTANPLYEFASSYAWNHQLTTLLALAAVLVFLWTARGKHSLVGLLTAGLLTGMSIGVRIYFVTILPAFALALFFHPAGKGVRSFIRLAVVYAMGVVVALLPILGYWLADPQRFWFNNIANHSLDTLYRMQTGFDGPMTLPGVFGYFWGSVVSQPGNLALVLGLLCLVYPMGIWQVFKRRGIQNNDHGNTFEWLFWLSVVPLAEVGALTVAPPWYQRFYSAVPLVICALVFGLAQLLKQADLRRPLALLIFVEVVLLVNTYQLDDYRRVTFLLHPETWRPLTYHEAGQKIKDQVGEGKVLTLSPVFPLEAGLPIYPEFSSGPLLWRISGLVDAEQREALGVISSAELDAFLANDPPAGILVGAEKSVEGPLNDYALRNGYQQVPISDDLSLWVKP